jgi:hypothetical protein
VLGNTEIVGNLFVTGSIILTGSTNINVGGTGSALTVYNNATLIGTRNILNFISGSGLLITGTDTGTQINLNVNTGSGVATLTGGLVPTGELGTGAVDATKFLRGDQIWFTPPAGGVNNVRYVAATYATGGTGASGSPWTGWDNSVNGAFVGLPAATQPLIIAFEPGWFLTTGSIIVNHSNISILGYGPESIVNFTGSVSGDGFAWYGTSSSPYSGIMVSGLHLIGNLNSLSVNQHAINLQNCVDSWIVSNWIELFSGDAITTSTTGSQFIVDNYLKNNGSGFNGYAINISGSGTSATAARNKLIGNTNGINATAGIGFIRDNDGYNPVGYITPDITPGSSPYVYVNNDNVRENVFIVSGSNIIVTGSGGFSYPISGPITVDPAQAISISYSLAPIIQRMGI